MSFDGSPARALWHTDDDDDNCQYSCSCCINGRCKDDSECRHTGAIIGAVVGSIAFVTLIVLFWICWRRRRRRAWLRRREHEHHYHHMHDQPVDVLAIPVSPQGGFVAPGATYQPQQNYPQPQGYAPQGYQPQYPPTAYPANAYPSNAYPSNAYPNNGYAGTYQQPIPYASAAIPAPPNTKS